MRKTENAAAKRQAAIDWIEAMRRDGFVLVSRGDPADLNSYGCRKNLSEGHDTEALLSALK